MAAPPTTARIIALALAVGGCAAAPTLDPASIGGSTIGDPLFPRLGNLGYDVGAYEVRITADPARQEATIAEVVTARATQPLARFSLDYTGDLVQAVAIDGLPAAFESVDGDLLITPPSPVAADSTFRVAIDLAGRPRGIRSTWGWQHIEGQIVAFGIYDGLVSWLPSNGDPADKAVVDLWLDVPAAATGVGPGVLVDAPIEGDRRTWHWRAGPTNTLNLVVREYEAVSLGSPGGVTVTSYVPASIGPRQRARLDVVPRLVEMLEDRVGPYPYEALNFVWVDQFTGVPDEGLVLWGADFGDPEQLAHVLGHLWFSTNASPARPIDSWLRSAFANYCDLLWFELDGGKEARDAILRDWHRRLGSQTEPPAAPSDLTDNQALFSRGPLGLHALRVRVGDETFFAILRTWVKEHHRGAARLDAFFETAERVSGQQLDDWWQAWLLDEAVPPLSELGLTE